jgi:hypothetical protein
MNLRKGIFEHPSLGRITGLVNLDILSVRVHLSSVEGRGESSTGEDGKSEHGGQHSGGASEVLDKYVVESSLERS